MRLSDFILRDLEPIAKQWEAFAATLLPAAGHMEPRELREHVKGMLQDVAMDLRT
jgi:hypothetical protein